MINQTSYITLLTSMARYLFKMYFEYLYLTNKFPNIIKINQLIFSVSRKIHII